MSCLFRLALPGAMVCLLGLAAGPLHATILVAGTNPAAGGGFYVENDSFFGTFSYEQLFTLSNAAQVTSLSINAASLSAQTLEVQLFSGLGLENTGTLLQTFDINVPGGWDGNNLDMPTITTPASFLLAAGSYSLLLSLPTLSPSGDLIYENTADSSNTPGGSLGGTHTSTGVIPQPISSLSLMAIQPVLHPKRDRCCCSRLASSELPRGGAGAISSSKSRPA
jgi:hypothetical protein